MKGKNMVSIGMAQCELGVEGAKAVAELVSLIPSITDLDLFMTGLTEEGVTAICEAFRSNQKTKVASLNFKSNFICSVGAKAVAAMVAVTSSITSVSNVPQSQPVTMFA